MSEVRVVPARRPAVWQPKQPVFWLFLVLFVCCAAFIVLEIAFVGARPAALLAALLLFLVQGVVLVLVAWAMPRFRRQPLSLRLAALAWGLAVASQLAILMGGPAHDLLVELGLKSFAASLSAPINEDLLRLLGVLLVLSLGSRVRLTVMDGALYGFLVGAGFEIIENLLFAVGGDCFASTLSMGFQRMYLGFGLHALWTTLAGAALAYCLSRSQAGLPGRWWVLAPAILVPMLLHAAWDAPGLSIFMILRYALYAVLYAASLAVWLWAVRWGRRSEFEWYRSLGGSIASLDEFKRLPRIERRRLAAEAVAAERAGDTVRPTPAP